MMTKLRWEVLYRNLESCLITFQLNYPNYHYRNKAVQDAARRKVENAVHAARIYLELNQEAQDLLRSPARDSNGQTFQYDKFFTVEWFARDMNRFLKAIRAKINNLPD